MNENKKLRDSVGERLLVLAFNLAMLPGVDIAKKKDIINILYSFMYNPDDMDLKTICKLEVLLGEDLLIIPTKQQWRKIKLQRLNEICNEKG